MPTEIEAKFLQVDHDEIRERLQASGGMLQHPMRLMRREVFDHPDHRYQKAGHKERLRIRDEGDKQTITYKKALPDLNYVHEIETTVGSYDAMQQLLVAVGLTPYSYQESKRETWHLGEVEVVLDEWPWLEPYIEIEGPSEKAIQTATKQLGLNWSDARFGSVDTAYRAQYLGMTEHESIGDLPEVKFNTPLSDYLKERLG